MFTLNQPRDRGGLWQFTGGNETKYKSDAFLGTTNVAVPHYGRNETQLLGICGSAIACDVKGAVNSIRGVMGASRNGDFIQPENRPLLDGMHNEFNFGGRIIRLVDAGCDLNTPFLPASFDPSFVIFALDSVTLGAEPGHELRIARDHVQQSIRFDRLERSNLYKVMFANGQRKVVAYVMGINGGPMMEDTQHPPCRSMRPPTAASSHR